VVGDFVEGGENRLVDGEVFLDLVALSSCSLVSGRYQVSTG